MKIRFYDDDVKNRFPLYPVTVSEKYEQVPVLRNGGHGFHQIFSVVQGGGRLRIGDNTYDVCTGDMFFIPKGTSHEYRGNDGDFYTCFMGFDGYGCDKLLDYFHVPADGFCTGKITPIIYSRFKDMFKIFYTCTDAKLCAKAYGLAVDFFEAAQSSEPSPLDSVLNYLEQNYALPLTLADIASVYPYSKSKLCRDFYKANSVTVFEKLTEIRLKHAYFLIENQKEIKIKSVAESCGYSDTSYFCRMFKRAYGKSPESVRNKKDFRQ